MFKISFAAWAAIAPELLLLIAAVAIIVLSSMKSEFRFQLGTALGGLVLAGLVSSLFVFAEGGSRSIFPHADSISRVVLDAYTAVFFIIFVGIGLVTCLLSVRYLEMNKSLRGEYFALVLFGIIGMMIMVSARDLLVMFLGMETMSIAAYMLVGFLIPARRSQEAAMKFFLTGAFGTAIFLFGLAYTFGATGSIDFVMIGELAAKKMSSTTFFGIGMVFLLVGFAFKVAAVPFHMWLPDVEDGAPTPVTAFMATGIKTAAFVVMARLVMVSFNVQPLAWLDMVLVGLCIGTMLWGNLAAIAQTSIKRLLAYSSLGHAGYLMMALVARNEPEAAMSGLQFYLFVYMLMNAGAFSVILIFERLEGRKLQIANYSGLAARYPGLAACLALFLLSLAGLPPTAGFMGKWVLFGGAVKAGYIGLAIIGVLTSILAVYAHVKVVYTMFMKPMTVATADAGPEFPAERALSWFLALAVIGFGVMPLSLAVVSKDSTKYAGWNKTLIKKAVKRQKKQVAPRKKKAASRKPIVRKAVKRIQKRPIHKRPTSLPTPRTALRR